MLRQQRRSNDLEQYKKYIAPIAIIGVIFILIIKSIFSGGTGGNSKNVGTGGYLIATPTNEKVVADIYMSGDSKKQITGPTKFYSSDTKIKVEEASLGEVTLNEENSNSVTSLDKLAEVAFKGKTGETIIYELLNGKIFIESNNTSYKIKMPVFELDLTKNSVAIVSKTEMGSSVYIMKGEALATKDGKNVKIGVGQQLEYLKYSKDPIDTKVAPINDDTRSSDEFYIKHNGDNYLKSNYSETGSGETNTLSGGLIGSGSSLDQSQAKKSIVIVYPTDEQTVDTNTIDIEGKLVSSKIEKVTINDKETLINKETKSFSLKGFKLSSSVNNLVYKTFDIDGVIISKGVFTVYTTSIKNDGASGETGPKLVNYPISNKDFKILSPTSNPYKTTEDAVRIEGRIVKSGIVKYITVNDYRLTKFVSGGTYWYYFANKVGGTMKDGINNYEIKYFGENDTVLFTQMFVLVREVKEDTTGTGVTQ